MFALGVTVIGLTLVGLMVLALVVGHSGEAVVLGVLAVLVVSGLLFARRFLEGWVHRRFG